jgi:hypothetical protein
MGMGIDEDEDGSTSTVNPSISEEVVDVIDDGGDEEEMIAVRTLMTVVAWMIVVGTLIWTRDCDIAVAVAVAVAMAVAVDIIVRV